MIAIKDVDHELAQLGARLREVRIARDETMRVFAERIGVSIPTMRAMEQGANTVAIGHWANAMWALDRLDDLSSVLAQTASPLDLARLQAQPQRRRASRRTR